MRLYVRFVVFDGEVLAVFMRTSAGIRYNGRTWMRGCYAHMGQHSVCYSGMEKRKRATPEQYAPLLQELQAIGYEPILV